MAACGGSGADDGDGLNDEQQQFADAIANDMVEPDVVDQDEADCWATSVVKRFGIERLSELGFNDEEGADFDTLKAAGATPEEAAQFTDAFFECLDATEILETGLANEVGDDAASCAIDKLDETTLKSLLTTQFYDGGDPSVDVQETVLAALAECGAG